MQNQLVGSFGRTIAFVIPGMIALYALAFFVPSLHAWFGLTQQPTIAGFLFVVLGSIGLGVFVSGIRWRALDWLLMPKVDLDHAPDTEPSTRAGYATGYAGFDLCATTIGDSTSVRDTPTNISLKRPALLYSGIGAAVAGVLLLTVFRDVEAMEDVSVTMVVPGGVRIEKAISF